MNKSSWNSDMRIALLSTVNAPMLGNFIKTFVENNIEIDSIIFDSKIESKKDLEIYKERTGGKIRYISLYEFENYHIPYFFVQNHSSEVTKSLVLEREIDILINAGTPRILKKNILNTPRIGVLNCHPGLLPEFRGCTCVEWAIYLDEQIGNTVHFMSDKIDEGPIILKDKLSFLKSDRYEDIRIKVYKNSFDLMTRSIKKIMKNKIGDIKNINYPNNGKYFGVISNSKLKEVKNKVNNGLYIYQY